MGEVHPFSGKKVLIATPIFDGKVTIQYHQNLLETIPHLVAHKIGFTMMNEARNLIHQARNRGAHYALNNGFDKILFIDADISWKGIDVLRLLASDKRVIGGLYPLKTFPVKLNFVPPEGLYTTKTFDPNEFVTTHADPKTGEVEVEMLPTGFMCIDCSVFRDLDPHVEKYHHRDQHELKVQHENMYFPFKIAPDGFLYTEDWGFCDLVRNKLNEKIYWHTRVIVDHVGSHTYSALTPIDKSYKKIDIHEKNTDDQASQKANQIQSIKRENPFKKWPRNLQCFCGSGKKFKKCHDQELATHVDISEAIVLQPDFDRMLKEVQGRASQGIGYKLQEPAI